MTLRIIKLETTKLLFSNSFN